MPNLSREISDYERDRYLGQTSDVEIDFFGEPDTEEYQASLSRGILAARNSGRDIMKPGDRFLKRLADFRMRSAGIKIPEDGSIYDPKRFETMPTEGNEDAQAREYISLASSVSGPWSSLYKRPNEYSVGKLHPIDNSRFIPGEVPKIGALAKEVDDEIYTHAFCSFGKYNEPRFINLLPNLIVEEIKNEDGDTEKVIRINSNTITPMPPDGTAINASGVIYTVQDGELVLDEENSEIVITHEPEKKRLISVKDGCSSYSLPIQEPIYLPINLEGAKHFRGSATLEVLGGIINDDKTVSRISMLTTSGFNIYHGEFRDENDAISERMLVDNPLFRKLKLKVRDYDGEGFSLDSNFVLHMVGKTPIWFREDFPLVPGKKLWMKMLPNGPKEVRNPGWFQIEMNEEGKIVHSDTGESIDPEWFKDYEQYAELFHEQHDLESEDDMNTVGKIFNESIMFSGMDNSIIPITGLSFIR